MLFQIVFGLSVSYVKFSFFGSWIFNFLLVSGHCDISHVLLYRVFLNLIDKLWD